MTARAQTDLPVGLDQTPIQRLIKKSKQEQQNKSVNQTLNLTATLMSGDLWAGGQGWNGPLPKGARLGTQDTIDEIERTFVSRNLARDVVTRHRHGVSGREPIFSVVPRRLRSKNEKPTAEEQAKIDEFTSALIEWWEFTGAWTVLGDALETGLALGEAGIMRLFLPERNTIPVYEDATQQKVIARTVPRGLDLAAAMKLWSIHHPNWKQAGVIRDIDEQVSGAWFQREEENGRTRWEIHERRDGLGNDRSAVYPFVNDSGEIIDTEVVYPVPDLLMYEFKVAPIITDSIRRLLQFASKALTMGSRNIDLGGFLERTILNAQMPGEWKTEEDGSKKFFPANYQTGPGITNFLAGKALFSEDPETKRMVPNGNFATPNVVYKDPTDFKVFRDAFDTAREMILDEANQLHVLLSGDAAASGVARQQAVNDFVTSLQPTRVALERGVIWMLETVLRLGLYLTGREAEFTPYRISVTGRISAVQPTPQDVAMALELHKAGAISRETLSSRIGIEDYEAESKRIAAEGVSRTTAIELVQRLPVWLGMRALMLAYPELQISEEDINRQKDIDLASPVETNQDLNDNVDLEGFEDKTSKSDNPAPDKR